MKTFIKLDWVLLDKEYSSIDDALETLDKNFTRSVDNYFINVKWYVVVWIISNDSIQTLIIYTWEADED